MDVRNYAHYFLYYTRILAYGESVATPTSFIFYVSVRFRSLLARTADTSAVLSVIDKK